MQDDDDNASDATDDDQSVRSTSQSNRRSGKGKSRNKKDHDRDEETAWNGFQQRLEETTDDESQMVHKQSHQAKKFDDLGDMILIDSGSSVKATFMNPDLLTDIKPSKKTLNMRTNAGSKRITMEGQVKGFGTTWYDPDSIANIFAFSHMVDECDRVLYDSWKDDAIHVWTDKDAPDKGLVKFERTPQNLYAYKPSDKYKCQVAKEKNMLSPKKEPKRKRLTVWCRL